MNTKPLILLDHPPGGQSSGIRAPRYGYLILVHLKLRFRDRGSRVSSSQRRSRSISPVIHPPWSRSHFERRKLITKETRDGVFKIPVEAFKVVKCCIFTCRRYLAEPSDIIIFLHGVLGTFLRDLSCYDNQ